MLYNASHITRHRYATPVVSSLSEVRLTPRSSAGQRVLESAIRVHPEPVHWQRRTDYFGNVVTSFEILESHDCLIVEAGSLVEVEPAAMASSDISWEAARGRVAAPDVAELMEASEYLFDSPYVATHAELAEFARPSFSLGRPLLEAADELSHRIFTEFRYEPMSTTIDMPLLEVLGSRRGVCQDFAHVMIGALRSLGLPARYVSGYLRSRTDYRGAEASHAWVQVYVPGSGWHNFDPTNDVVPTDRHLVLAWGRDYGDVAPVKGVTIGGGSQGIEVEVRVQPALDPAG